jgi:hypothetical protein
MERIRIGVIGSNLCSNEVSKLAFEVGKEIANAGAILLCGGLGGVMEAACQGAKSAGGLTIGILPGYSDAEANRYVDIPIVTGLSHARNVIVVRSSQALIAIEGSYGTLSEIAFALTLGVPVVGLRTWKMERRGHEVPKIIRVDNAKEAVSEALRLVRNK